jgi:hypothetical protein
VETGSGNPVVVQVEKRNPLQVSLCLVSTLWPPVLGEREEEILGTPQAPAAFCCTLTAAGLWGRIAIRAYPHPCEHEDRGSSPGPGRDESLAPSSSTSSLFWQRGTPRELSNRLSHLQPAGLVWYNSNIRLDSVRKILVTRKTCR